MDCIVKNKEVIADSIKKELKSSGMFHEANGKIIANGKDHSDALNKKLVSFLEKLNITPEFRKELKSVSPYDASSLTDLVQKIVMIRDDYKNEGLAKETAYVAYSMLGRRNKIRTDLIHSIDNIDNYQQVFDDYQKRNPNLHPYKIKELIVIDFLADAIRNNFESPRDSYINRKAKYWEIGGNSELAKKINYLLFLIEKQLRKIIDTKLDNDELQDLMDDIAHDILKQNFDKFGAELSSEDQLTNYEKTIAKNPAAEKMITNFQNLGLLLTGSLSLRRQGTLYRSEKEDLHDLDFTLPKERLLNELEQLNLVPVGALDGLPADLKLEILEREFRREFYKAPKKMANKLPIVQNIRQIYRNFVITKAYRQPGTNAYTITGTIGNMDIDIFMVEESNLDTREKGFQDWEPIFIAKLKTIGGRKKDIKDFANYVPYNVKPTVAETVGLRHFTFEPISNDLDKTDPAMKLDTQGELDRINNKYGQIVATMENDEVTINVDDYLSSSLTVQATLESHKLDESDREGFFSPLATPVPNAANTNRKLGSLTQFLKFSDILIKRQQMRLELIRQKRAKLKGNYDKNRKELYRLKKLEKSLADRLFGVEAKGIKGAFEEYSDLAAIREITSIAPFVASHMRRVRELSTSEEPEDIAEALNIIGFYDALGTFDPREKNPMFSNEEMFPDGINFNPRLVKVREKFEEWKNEFNHLKATIRATEKRIVEKLVNEDPRVQKRYGHMTYAEIMHELEGLGDIWEVDMIAMDIGYAISDNLSLLEQVISATTHDVVEEESVNSRGIIERIDKIAKELNKIVDILGNPKHRGTEKFKMFIDENTGELVDRYSSKYHFAHRNMLDTYDDMIAKSKQAKTVDKRNKLRKEAKAFKRKWYRENTIDINPVLFEELYPINDSDAFTDAQKQALLDKRREIREQFTDEEYKDLIEKAKKSYDEYEEELDELIKLLIDEEGVASEDDLSPISKHEIELFEVTRNPIFYGEFQYNKKNSEILTAEGSKPLYPSDDYSVRVPKHGQGYYDEKYKKIAGNKILKDFYDIAMDVLTRMYSTLPPHIAKQITPRTIPNMEKSFFGMMLETKDVGMITKVPKELWDTMNKALMTKEGSEFVSESSEVAGVTNESPNAMFIKSNSEAIKSIFTSTMFDFLQLNKNVLVPKVNQRLVLPINNLNKEQIKRIKQILEFIGEDPRPYFIKSTNEQGHTIPQKSIAIGSIIHNYATKKVFETQSTDLPMIMKYFSKMSSEYSARVRLQPLMKIVIRHHNEIKNPDKTKFGTIKKIMGKTKEEDRISATGKRVNAIARLESFYQRVILGNYSSQNKADIKLGKKHYTEEEEALKVVLAKQSEILNKRIEELSKLDPEKNPFAVNEMESLQYQLRKIEAIDKNLGESYSLRSMYQTLLEYMKFIGLAYKFKSALNNFLEGQISNSVAAQQGVFFSEDSYYRATRLIGGATVRFFSGRKISTGQSAKIRTLMDRYDILQDASDVLQQSSRNTTLFRSNWYKPYEIVSRTEYQNQSPIMIAILMDTIIEGDKGQKSSVFDAMDENGRLKPGFDTQENIENWEQADGEHYRMVKLQINNAITNIHGDYDSFRGSIMGSNNYVKPFLMFKRWMPMQFHLRFAKEQDNLVVGKFKGRYRSHTKLTGGLTGASLGSGAAMALGALTTIGGIGLGAFVAGGAAMGMYLSAKHGMNQSASNIRLLSFSISQFIKKIVGFPINIAAGRTLIGRSTVTANDLGISQLDFNNLKANIQELTNQFYLLMLQAFILSFIPDPDDDEELTFEQKQDIKRMIAMRNLIMNQTNQLISQMQMYNNPNAIYDNLIVNNPAIMFEKNVFALLESIALATNGNILETRGPYVGDNRMERRFRKLLPGPLQKWQGFYSSTKEQWVATPLDGLATPSWKKDRKEVENVREQERIRLRNYFEKLNEDGANYSEKDINKEIQIYLDAEYPLPQNPNKEEPPKSGKSKSKSRKRTKKGNTTSSDREDIKELIND